MVLIYHHSCSNAKICDFYADYMKRDKGADFRRKVIMKLDGGKYTCIANPSCDRIRMLNLLEKIAEGKGAKK